MSPTKKKCSNNQTARNRVIKTLTLSLEKNCSSYKWFGPLAGAIRNRDFPRLYRLSDLLSTEVFEGTAEHFAANQIVALVKKYPWTPKETGLPDPKETAVNTFWRAEKACRKSNKRLLRYSRTFSPFIEEMRRQIHLLLGDEPDLKEIYRECDFSSGANIGVHGNATNLYRKLYAESWSVTPSALPYALAAIRSNEQFLWSVQRSDAVIRCLNPDPSEWRIKLKETSANKVSFVPKTAKTHRAIAVEPLLNSLVQKGIETVLRAKLMRWGIDLRDQSRNQELARLGSIDGSLCTIDLSSASDSISISLCKEVLPAAWFGLLNCTRSPSFVLDGTIHRAEKFVSMGNGFCFPLETIIFAAAVRAIRAECPDRRYAVYGDDIIVPVDYASKLIELLQFLGFTPNRDKTFLAGPFRESCGADWYLGQDVRPVYLDYHLADISDLMIFHNATYRSDRCALFFTEVRDFLLDEGGPDVFVRPLTSKPRFPQGISRLELKNLNGAYSVPIDVFMGSKHSRWNQHEQRWSWKEYLFTSVPDRPTGDAFCFNHSRYLRSLQNGAADLSLRYTAKRRVTIK